MHQKEICPFQHRKITDKLQKDSSGNREKTNVWQSCHLSRLLHFHFWRSIRSSYNRHIACHFRCLELSKSALCHILSDCHPFGYLTKIKVQPHSYAYFCIKTILSCRNLSTETSRAGRVSRSSNVSNGRHFYAFFVIF